MRVMTANPAPNPSTISLPGPAPEVEVTKDMVRRGLVVAPLLILLCGVIWGLDGAVSCAYGVAIVLVNFSLAAGTVAVTARISLSVMMAGILFGFLVRLGLIFIAVWPVKDAAWISLGSLGATIVVTHLGLLIWEMKYLAISLAHPGLTPAHPTDNRNGPT